LLCYEIAGSRGGRETVFDLLSERKEVKCLTGEDGHVHVRGAHSERCTSAEGLQTTLRAAFACRSSEQTERNESSSRSHAVIELHLPVRRPTGGSAAGADLTAKAGVETGVASEGILRIVDLAGSERNFETTKHTRKMAERGGHINYSLLMLKECARIMHRNRQRQDEGNLNKLQHIPFRSSRLTHLLQTSFTDNEHRTVVVTTLSPSPPDVEHTLNSLQHVGMMRSGRAGDRARLEAARAERAERTAAAASGGSADGFSRVEGRGRSLHSSLQDARQGQLKFKAFNQNTGTGGSIMKKYEPENVKIEAFIDPRWHREMNVVVEEDLWVLKDADAEVVQLLTRWREEQWQARCAHDVARWDATAVASFVHSLGLVGRIRLPSTMTGAQLCRLSARNIAALCTDAAAAEAFNEALLNERATNRDVEHSQAGRNAKMAGLSVNRVSAALGGE